MYSRDRETGTLQAQFVTSDSEVQQTVALPQV